MHGYTVNDDGEIEEGQWLVGFGREVLAYIDRPLAVYKALLYQVKS
jgi:hypothetical protein